MFSYNGLSKLNINRYIPLFLAFFVYLSLATIALTSNISAFANTITIDTTFQSSQPPQPNAYYWSGGIVKADLQSNGKIIVVGGVGGGGLSPVDSEGNLSVSETTIARLNSNGSIDSSFNFSYMASNQLVFCRDVRVQSDDKILVAGCLGSSNTVTNNNTLLRLNSDGTLDTQFVNNARVAIADARRIPTRFRIEEVELQSDGKIIFGGEGIFGRLNSDGTLDTSFNQTIVNNGSVFVRTIVIQPDGKSLISYADFNESLPVAGYSRLSRLNTDGTTDSTFSTVVDNTVTDIEFLPDGKMIVVGYFSTISESSTFSIGRLNSDGSYDTSFAVGQQGFNTTNDGQPIPGYIEGVHLGPDGKIYVGGQLTSYGDTSVSGMVRLNMDGTLDDDFVSGDVNLGYGSAFDYIITANDQMLAYGEFQECVLSWVNFEITPCMNIARLNITPEQPDPVDEATLTIGQVDRGDHVEISVCIQTTGLSFRLADASTWINYDGEAYNNGQLDDIGRFSSGSGYAPMALNQTIDTSTTDTVSVRVDYVGDGVTPGSVGLEVSTDVELIGSFHLSKTGSMAPQVSLNNSGTAFYSVAGGQVPVNLLTQYVPYNCHSSIMTQTNIGDSTNCTTTYSVTTPDTYTCDFGLSGNTYNEYRLTNSFNAITGEGSSNNVLPGSESDDCSIVFNGETNVYFSCGNIKTVGNSDNYASSGLNNVLIYTSDEYSNAADRGEVNIVIPLTQANLRFYLSGAYRITEGNMRTSLRAANIVPTSQPYNVSPWNYNGNETVNGPINNDIVDWVLIEVRDNNANLIQTRAALLRNDGQVVDPTTQTPGLLLDNIDDTTQVRFVIRHRNHLAFASDTAITLKPGNSNPDSDFTGNVNVRSSNQSMITTGIYGMRSANTNGDGQIIAGDRVAARLGNESLNVYLNRDLNLDGIVNSTDRNLSRLAQEAFTDLGI